MPDWPECHECGDTIHNDDDACVFEDEWYCSGCVPECRGNCGDSAERIVKDADGENQPCCNSSKCRLFIQAHKECARCAKLVPKGPGRVYCEVHKQYAHDKAEADPVPAVEELADQLSGGEVREPTASDLDQALSASLEAVP